MEMTSQQRLLELYLANVDMIWDGFPVAFNAPRRDFIEAFNLMDFPSVKDEKYRHRDVKTLFEGDWEYYFIPTAPLVGVDPIIEDGHSVILKNGFCNPELGLRQTKEGAIYGSLKSAAVRLESQVMKYYNTFADNNSEAVVALNSAFIQDGVFIYVPEGVTVENPFVLTHYYHTCDESQACYSRVLLILEKDARANVVSEYRSSSTGRFLVNCVSEVSLGEGAQLEMAELERINDSSSLLLNSYSSQAKGSQYKYTGLVSGGLNNFMSGKTNLDGEHCNCEINTLYMATADQRCDVAYIMNHNKSDCQSSQLIKGVAGGEAIGSFTGRVYVAPQAQRTDAQQQSRNLQLSGNARIYTEPQLEIYADDVKCTHGATVGRIEDESIYYMRQRGLSEQQARKLQMSGFVNDVLNRCTIEPLCDKMEALAAERIEDI